MAKINVKGMGVVVPNFNYGEFALIKSKAGLNNLKK
jgi:hypothetical protein